MDALDKLVEFGAIAAIGILLLSLWQQSQARNAAMQAALLKQGGYTSLETMGGDMLWNLMNGGKLG